ncbi:2-succinyl-5-enolpyruvyl-6-hydroxy-3-cyclohexene-1-carboxylic-acid synthase [Nanchangia anserum]|uniref:2-succinyl-5-enolpyruvyl-6-hydroxy-3-cyclohexene-1-carboxylate synthase n=1 Tax=Nanchangia anserum TaxID=2692125 RepID=A0A8I0KNJ3_9ACTO|nr:2-succinyl-5-enolpyruvyl-6-hydroxy-3-cyclohexene-1-carboxylic-acid synthase [Nanchangia anserum]MBD3689346.1 2-succinyl-5-enolpyruvyl-6-hydroxy-3-cyclohexene-1-carboxylic-acid synthase [Nanchangia anserum]QOX81552.1 2-succinyl-5-enolpyruvyl-6-hydroxy-3-cyclohexene-1-carboxylic-acid synthase [Nanchangia anserum]
MTAAALTRARGVVSALVAGGVRDVVYCPGSRDAPFAYALADAEEAGLVRIHVRIDERSAAFFALGISRAGELTRRSASPVALVMTSGTAVANAHPAVLEATHACVPLVVVAADRPAEMRGTGANQTTNHLAVLAGTVRGTWDVTRGTGSHAATRAVEVARGGELPPGPVLLNVQLAPPLYDAAAAKWDPASVAAARPAEATETLASPEHTATFIPVSDPVASPTLADLGLDPAQPGIIVAGNQAHLCRGGETVPELAAALGWPLLAEPGSGVRRAPAVTHYQQLLADRPDEVAQARQVLVVGHPTLSRPVTALLSDTTRHIVAITRAGTHTALAGAVAIVGDRVPAAPARPRPDVAAWGNRWQSVDAGYAPADARERVLARVWERHVEDGPRPPILVIGASLSIRAIDRAGRVGTSCPPVLANRGLAGIDGTVSFARGVAAATGEPVRVLLGDVTAMHDLGGLATGVLEDSDDNVQVIVVNDAGGQIFRSLEYGRDAASTHFHRFFATPQLAAFPALARGLGWDYVAATGPDEVDYVAASPVRGRSLVEVTLE